MTTPASLPSPRAPFTPGKLSTGFPQVVHNLRVMCDNVGFQFGKDRNSLEYRTFGGVFVVGFCGGFLWWVSVVWWRCYANFAYLPGRSPGISFDRLRRIGALNRRDCFLPSREPGRPAVSYRPVVFYRQFTGDPGGDVATPALLRGAQNTALE